MSPSSTVIRCIELSGKIDAFCTKGHARLHAACCSSRHHTAYTFFFESLISLSTTMSFSWFSQLVRCCLFLALLSASCIASTRTPGDDNSLFSSLIKQQLEESVLERGQQRELSQSIGSFRALVLLVRFKDHQKLVLPDKQYFLDLCNNEITAYLKAQSYGKYKVSYCDVKDWITTDNTEEYYSGGIGNLRQPELAAGMFVPVLDTLDKRNTDWTLYDKDGDTNIDALLVLHSGYAAEQGMGTGCGAPHPDNRITSQGTRGSTGAWSSKDGSINLSGFSIASAWERLCEDRPAPMGVMTHEVRRKEKRPSFL